MKREVANENTEKNISMDDNDSPKLSVFIKSDKVQLIETSGDDTIINLEHKLSMKVTKR